MVSERNRYKEPHNAQFHVHKMPEEANPQEQDFFRGMLKNVLKLDGGDDCTSL